MTTISATTVLRSRHPQRPEIVLSTLLLRYPRWIHAELMTHRVFSRNAASSRAIPINKLIEDVENDPAVPLYWGKNQKGMQASEYMTGKDAEMAEYIWQAAMQDALDRARALAHHGLHKQIVNRLLEPFSHITVLVSATQWSNFLALRDHPDAEPHIQMLAREIRKCLEREDDIQTLQPGEWHLPFVDAVDEHGHAYALDREFICGEDRKKLSVARCASTSYKTVDGFDMTLERAIEIHDKLLASKPIHASPAEHVAFPDQYSLKEPLYNQSPWSRPDLHGNFTGFCQYRKMLQDECL